MVDEIKDVLPNVPVLSNDEFKAIIAATFDSKKINVRGRIFDGTADVAPADIAALFTRIEKPDLVSHALALRLENADTNDQGFADAIPRLLKGNLQKGDLDALLKDGIPLQGSKLDFEQCLNAGGDLNYTNVCSATRGDWKNTPQR